MPPRRSAPPINSEALARLQERITARYGIRVAEGDPYALEQALMRGARRTGHTLEAYVAKLTGDLGLGELERLAAELTVPETFFFRHSEHLYALRDEIVPAFCNQAQNRGRPLRILSAGCCTGEEPASIVMFLQQRYPHLEVSVVATDLNPRYLEHAKRRIYRPWALRDCPEAMRVRYFRHLRSGEFELDPAVTERIRFVPHNLVADPLPDPRLGLDAFDVIFCRNVLMYFRPEAQRRALEGLVECLVPGGALFLGHAEWGMCSGLPLRAMPEHGPAAFQRLSEVEDSSRLEPLLNGTAVPATARTASPFAPAATEASAPPAWPPWSEESEAAVAVEPPHAPASEDAVTLPAQTDESSEAAPPAEMSEPDLLARHKAKPTCVATMLALARLHADRGELEQAQSWCNLAEERAPFDAEVQIMHAVLALGSNEMDRAVAALRRALYLDPDHLCALFQLALLLDAQGNRGQIAVLCRRIEQLVASREDEDVALSEGAVTVGFLRQWVRSRREG